MYGGCVPDPEICHCSCHRDGGVHVTACCSHCKYCGRNIVISCVDSHEKKCSMNPENFKHFQENLEDGIDKLSEGEKTADIMKKRMTI